MSTVYKEDNVQQDINRTGKHEIRTQRKHVTKRTVHTHRTRNNKSTNHSPLKLVLSVGEYGSGLAMVSLPRGASVLRSGTMAW